MLKNLITRFINPRQNGLNMIMNR